MIKISTIFRPSSITSSIPESQLFESNRLFCLRKGSPSPFFPNKDNSSYLEEQSRGIRGRAPFQPTSSEIKVASRNISPLLYFCFTDSKCQWALSPPMAAILVFPPLDIETRRNVKSRFAQEEKGTGETRISRRMKREKACVSDEEKSKKWSAINGKRNRQRMENNWRKMEARISKENASRWKKGGSSREGDSCLDSLLCSDFFFISVWRRGRGSLRRSWRREGGACVPLSFLSRYLHPLLKWLFELFRSFCFFTAIVARSIRSREFD